VSVVIQHAERVRCILLSSVTCLVVLCFYTLSHELHDFRKEKLLNVKSVFRFFLRLVSETFLILRRIQRDIVINVKTSSCKVPVILDIY
jgi:hypothetical protein